MIEEGRTPRYGHGHVRKRPHCFHRAFTAGLRGNHDSGVPSGKPDYMISLSLICLR